MAAATSIRAFNVLDTAVGDSILPIFTANGSPTNGTNGTFAGVAGPGALLLTTEPALYQNTNTKASPTWSVIESLGGVDAIFASPPALGSTAPAEVSTDYLQVDTGTKTASATSGAATLNKMAGVITSESITTAAGSDYTLTLTNSDIAAADQVMASVQLGSATTGEPAITSVTPAAGSVVIKVRNIAASAAFNGTIVISFVVFKN